MFFHLMLKSMMMSTQPQTTQTQALPLHKAMPSLLMKLSLMSLLHSMTKSL
jgi:hypothetical protein